MMPSTNRYIIAIAVAVALLAANVVIRYSAGYNKEVDWYVSNLNYDFVATVDSIKVLKDGKGFLYCSKRTGMLNYDREDSLAKTLNHYKRLRLLRFEGPSIKVFNGVVESFKKDDTVIVNSDANRFLIRRDGRNIRDYNVRDLLGKVYL